VSTVISPKTFSFSILVDSCGSKTVHSEG
jgi:hypothetical protein